MKQLISAIRNAGVEPGDIQTDYFHVDIAYVPNQGSVVAYYVVTRQVQVVLKKVAKFEDLLNSGLRAGANHLACTADSPLWLNRSLSEGQAQGEKPAQDQCNDVVADTIAR